MERIENIIRDSINVHEHVLSSKETVKKIQEIVDLILKTYRKRGKVLLCGNGGSAADAQHISAELSGKFYLDRPPLFAEALHVNSSYLTAVANDYSYELVVSRLVESKGVKGDILIGISTSGRSRNVYNALTKAKELGLHTVSFCGENKDIITEVSDFALNVPSTNTPRIQEVHILLGHIICELVEEELFGND